MNRSSLLAGAAAASLILTACSSSGSGNSSATTAAPAATSAAATAGSSAATSAAATAGSSAAAGAGITISGFAYSGTLTVKAGAKVAVTNKDSAAHTVTDKKTKKFDTGNIPGGGTGTFTAPTAPGSYPFGCTYHPKMAGTLVVTP